MTDDELEDLRATIAHLLQHDPDPAAAIATMIDQARDEGYDDGWEDAVGSDHHAPARPVDDVVESL